MIYQGKYENLAKYLEGLDQERVNMTFEEIEDILGEPLPEKTGPGGLTRLPTTMLSTAGSM